MKRKISSLIIIAMVLALMTSFAFSWGPIRVVVSGKLIKFPDAQPFIDNNSRTQVPVRFVSEDLGAEVAWEGRSQTITIKRSGEVITLKIGEKAIKKNNGTTTLDTAPLLKDGRTFVPLRFVSEALGEKVRWDGAIRTVYINETAETKEEIKVISGYVVPVNTGSKLNVRLELYEELGKNYPEIAIFVNSRINGADIEMQFKEAEEILLQKVEAEVVRQAIAYARTRGDYTEGLDEKKFRGKERTIHVGAGSYTGTYFHIYVN